MDKIIKILAAKYNIDEETVNKIVRSQFRFIAETIQEGEFQSVHLHHFGKFCVKPNALNRLNKLKELKNKDVETDTNI